MMRRRNEKGNATRRDATRDETRLQENMTWRSEVDERNQHDGPLNAATTLLRRAARAEDADGALDDWLILGV